MYNLLDKDVVKTDNVFYALRQNGGELWQEKEY